MLVIHSKVRRPQKERKKEGEREREKRWGCYVYRMWKSKEQWVVGVHQTFHPCQNMSRQSKEWKKKNDKAPQILPNQIPIDMLMSTQTTLPCKKRKNYHNPHTHHNIFLVPFSTSTHSHLLFHPQFPLSLPIHEKTLSTPTTIPTGNNI